MTDCHDEQTHPALVAHRGYAGRYPENTIVSIRAALDAGVKRVMMISTDKAVGPINLYGATKLAAEKLLVQSNAYAGGGQTRFSCVRYGNVIGSRGSVIAGGWGDDMPTVG